MATPRLSRLSDFQLADRTAMKAMIDEIATEVEEQFDDIQQQITDIAEAAKKAYVINPIPDVVIEADSVGTIKAGELTRNVNITASDGTADITTLVTWSRTVTSGITCTIGASTGVLAITAMTAQEVNIPIQFTYSGITRVGTVHVVKQNDVTEAAKLSVIIDPIPDVVIYADSTGTVKTGELPRNVELTASNGTASITASGTWSRTVTTGITCTIGASTGVLAITALSASEVSVPISFTYSGITRVGTVHVVKQNDVTEAAKLSVIIDPIPDVVIYADSTGTVKTGELPRNVELTASNGTASITASGTWSRTVTTGITCTIGASTGVLAITALDASEVSVPISFTYSGVTRTGTVHIVRQDDPPTTSSSGGGTSANTTTLGQTTGTTYDTTNAVSATLTVTAGTAGKVQCTAPVSFKRNSSSDGESGAFGKWQWRALAGSWADITTEGSDTTIAFTSTAPNGGIVNSTGNLPVTHTKIGLTSGTQYEFRFLWRRQDISGTGANIYRTSGILTADGTVA